MLKIKYIVELINYGVLMDPKLEKSWVVWTTKGKQLLKVEEILWLKNIKINRINKKCTYIGGLKTLKYAQKNVQTRFYVNYQKILNYLSYSDTSCISL